MTTATVTVRPGALFGLDSTDEGGVESLWHGILAVHLALGLCITRSFGGVLLVSSRNDILQFQRSSPIDVKLNPR